MVDFRTVDMAPAQARYALGYACVCAWAVILLIAPVFGIGSPAVHAAPASMLPGLITCLASLFFTKQFPSIAGRTGTVALSALLMAGGTLLCTFPATSSVAITRFAGLALSGLFAIVLIMAWFDVFARLKPRAVIVLAGCTITLSALMCWGILSCDSTTSSVLVSLLPMLSFVVLPASGAGETIIHAERVPYDENPNPTADRSVVEIVAAALPIRTLIGLAITFFIINLLGMLAPAFGSFSSAVSPISLLVPLGVTAFFIASAFVVRKRIDPSILFKILMFTFAALVLLLTFSIGINASLVFYAYIIAEVVMWAVLALLAKKTPVRPHHVFAVGWIAECAGSSLGQVLAPLFIGQPQAFFAVALMLILAAVGFAFSEGSLMLDVGFEDEGDDQPKRDTVGASTSEATGDGAAARMAGSAGMLPEAPLMHPVSAPCPASAPHPAPAPRPAPTPCPTRKPRLPNPARQPTRASPRAEWVPRPVQRPHLARRPPTPTRPPPRLIPMRPIHWMPSWPTTTSHRESVTCSSCG